MKLNINTDAAVRFTNELEKMHKKHLPSAVRGALNDAVFDVKTNTMPKTADQTFTNRQPNFFKANSRFENAKGFDVKSMKATVGFIEGGLKGGNNYAVKDLEEQEQGGVISNKGFIALKTARIGKSGNKNVRPNFRLTQIKNVVDARNSRSMNKKQQFIRAAIKAKELYGDNAFVLGNVWKGNRTLSKIDGISSGIKSRSLKIKRTPLYTFRKGRKISVASTTFMKRASMETGINIDDFFVKQAIRQLKIAAAKFK